MKDRITHILAYGWSVLLFPLFIPTYMMVAFCVCFSRLMIPLTVDFLRAAIGTTLMYTCLLPLGMLLILKALGYVSNLDVTNRKERTIPFVLSMGSLIAWIMAMIRLHMPAFIIASSISTTVLLVIVLIINLWWKISIHLTGMGSAVAIAWSMMMYFHSPSTLITCLMLAMTLLLMYARLRLDAHTPLQTVAGFLLGLIIVLIPNLFVL